MKAPGETLNVLVTDDRDVLAVRAGLLAGDIYADGEVWANSTALKAWHLLRQKQLDAGIAIPNDTLP